MILNSYAKINLSLEVLDRRENGYHDIYSVMQGIGLHDEVEIDKINPNEIDACCCEIDGVKVEFCMDCNTIPNSRENLAIRGAEAVINNLPSEASKPSAIRISIKKMLPVAAGIAGGSGNAAVCMLAMNALTGYTLSLRELMAIGIKVGSDVPFSLMMNAKMNSPVLAELAGIEEASTAAIISGIGEVVEPVEPIRKSVIMVNPGVSVSTKEVYEAIDSLADRKVNKNLFFNIMEQYTLENYPLAAETKKAIQDNLRADEVLMSGSGPTIVAYYDDAKQAHEDYEAALSLGWLKDNWRIWITETGGDCNGI